MHDLKNLPAVDQPERLAGRVEDEDIIVPNDGVEVCRVSYHNLMAQAPRELKDFLARELADGMR